MWTDGNGDVEYTIPSNAYSSGAGNVCLAPAGVNMPLPIASASTTQRFTGDASMPFTTDPGPVVNGLQTMPQRIRAKAGYVYLVFQMPATPGATVEVNVHDDGNRPIGSVVTDAAGAGVLALKLEVPAWLTFSLTGHGLPPSGVEYKLAINYHGVWM